MTTVPTVGTPTSAVSGSANALTIAKPAGVVDGDYLVMIGTHQNQVPADPSSSGWTRIGTAFITNDADIRGTGIYGRPIPSAAAETATSYTLAFGATGRCAAGILPVHGVDLSDPIAAFPAKSSTSGTARIMPTFTIPRDNVLVILAANNQVTSPNANTATISDGIMALLLDLAGAVAPADTTVTRSALKVYAREFDAGASGTETVTWTGAATGAAIIGVALNPKPDPVVTLDYAASWWDGSTETPAELSWWDGAAESDVSSILFQPLAQTVSQMLALSRPLRWAHRGGSANWPEFTIRAYRESAHYWQVDAVEVSVWQSASGTFWCNHDNSLSYATNGADTRNITDLTDTQLGAILVSPAHTDNLGQPSEHLVTLQQVVDFLPGVVIVVECKDYDVVRPGSRSALMTFINSNGGASRFIWKQAGPGTRFPASSTLTGWGYFFAGADMTNYTAKQSQWEFVGLDFNLTDTDLDAAIATAGAARVIDHILLTTTQLARLNSRGVRGHMIANVRDLVTRP